MAVIDSRTAGVLRPLSTEGAIPPEDALRRWMADLTGLPLSMVRKRWLSKPGTRPPLDADWVAVGVERVKTWGTPYQRGKKGVISAPESGDVVQESHQTLHCIASFYGPNAASLSDIFRDSAQIGQNADELQKADLNVQGVDDDVVHIPDFAFEQWIDRYDVTFRIGRMIRRTFGIRDLASVGSVEIITEKGKV